MIEKLNPLHKPRIQHPASGYSNTLSQNVEDMHRDYVVFQKNLKNLAMLYKTRHQLMESLNENGLYVSSCEPRSVVRLRKETLEPVLLTPHVDS